MTKEPPRTLRTGEHERVDGKPEGGQAPEVRDNVGQVCETGNLNRHLCLDIGEARSRGDDRLDTAHNRWSIGDHTRAYTLRVEDGDTTGRVERPSGPGWPGVVDVPAGVVGAGNRLCVVDPERHRHAPAADTLRRTRLDDGLDRGLGRKARELAAQPRRARQQGANRPRRHGQRQLLRTRGFKGDGQRIIGGPRVLPRETRREAQRHQRDLDVLILPAE